MITKQRDIADSKWSVDALHMYQKKLSSYSIPVSISLPLSCSCFGWGQVSIPVLQQQFWTSCPIELCLHSSIVMKTFILSRALFNLHKNLLAWLQNPFSWVSYWEEGFFFLACPGHFMHLLKNKHPHPCPCACLHWIGKYTLEGLKMITLPDGAGIRTQASFWLEQEELISENNFYSHHLVQSNLMFFSYSEIMKTLLQLLIQFINYLVLHFSNIFADNIFYACKKACKLYCHYKKHLSDLF